MKTNRYRSLSHWRDHAGEAFNAALVKYLFLYLILTAGEPDLLGAFIGLVGRLP